jgi:hypothetical protein
VVPNNNVDKLYIYIYICRLCIGFIGNIDTNYAVKICILIQNFSLKYHFQNYFPELELENYDLIGDPYNADLKWNIRTITEEDN